MFDVAELKRKLANIVRVTSIVSTKSAEGKALATVAIEEDESEFFPVVSFSNSFKKHWIPIRAGEQVLVFHPFGNANKGYIFRGVFFVGQKEPEGADNDTEIIEYSDGTRIEVALAEGTLKVTTGLKLVITAPNFKLDEAGNLEISGEITDNRGNLTAHEHAVENHTTAVER